MHRLEYLIKTSLCLSLLLISSLSAQLEVTINRREQFAKVTEEQIKEQKPKVLFNLFKALAAGAGMMSASMLPGIRGTGLQSGLMLGAIPLGAAIGNDDPVTKVTCFSAAAASVAIGGIGGLVTTDWSIQKIGSLPVDSFKKIAELLQEWKNRTAHSLVEQARNAAVTAAQKVATDARQVFDDAARQAAIAAFDAEIVRHNAEAMVAAAAQLKVTAGAVAVSGGFISQLGGTVFDRAARLLAKGQNYC